MRKLEKILIVDDDDSFVALVKKVLSDEKFLEIQTSRNGSRAIDIIKIFSPDIVIMDIHLPGHIDGFTAIKWIKSHDNEIEIIAISADSESQTHYKAISLGAFCFIRKNKKITQLLSRSISRLKKIKELQQKEEDYMTQARCVSYSKRSEKRKHFSDAERIAARVRLENNKEGING